MFKIASLIIIFVSFSYAGFIYGESFRKREQQLKECNKILLMLKNEIVFLYSPIEEAFGKVSKKCSEPMQHILLNLRAKLIDGNAESIYEAAKEEYNKVKEHLYFEKSDVCLFSDFFKSLGESTIDGQKALFDITEEELKISIKEAHELTKRNVKLYRYVGVCAGFIIVIFLI